MCPENMDHAVLILSAINNYHVKEKKGIYRTKEDEGNNKPLNKTGNA